MANENTRKIGTDAFKVGYRAFFSGLLDNPYPEHTHFGKEWLRGFNKAYFENVQQKSPTILDRRAS